MNARPNILILAALLALGGSASAEFTRIAAFSGTDSEGFETQDISGGPASCIADRVFGGRADLCTLNGTPEARIVEAWFYGCGMQEHDGIRFFGSGGPAIAIYFDAPVKRFGGYFGTNNPIVSGGLIRFLDANGFELYRDTIGAVNNCIWNWNGWDGGGAEIAWIEISSNYGNGGYLMMDDLEADISPASTGTAYCFCDGSSGMSGPCGNDGAEGRGCGNSVHAGGARLSASGWASVSGDSLVLHAEGLVHGYPALFFQGVRRAGNGAGVYFGDGIRCVAGRIVRLEVPLLVRGAATHSTVRLSTAGGVPVQAGETRYYQVWYRDAETSPCSSAFNLTNAVEVTWGM